MFCKGTVVLLARIPLEVTLNSRERFEKKSMIIKHKQGNLVT